MKIELLKGNCLELMKNLPDESIDMILADPPYGTTRNKWDSVIPLDKMWEQFRRVAKKNAAICIFSQMPFTAELVNSNRKDFRYEWIWQKPQGTGFLNANRMPMKAHENICVFYRAMPTYIPQYTWGGGIVKNHHAPSNNYGNYHSVVTVSDGRRFPTDVLRYNMARGSHPTQKPTDLLEYLIKTYTKEGETVLDPCMGSGSTGVACVNTGRDFIGMELNQGYFETASKRILEVQNAYIKGSERK